MALLCIYINGFGQKIDIAPFFINDRIPDLPLNNIINYKDSSATLSSFGHKLIILDFWATHCGPCIAMFPKEDSLQKEFEGKIQFVLVTFDEKKTVQKFFHNWDSANDIHLSMPIVTTDRLLRKLFRFQFIPHYVWISPDGTLMAQTSETFINRESINNVLQDISKTETRMKNEHWPKDMYGFPKPDIDFGQVLKAIKL